LKNVKLISKILITVLIATSVAIPTSQITYVSADTASDLEDEKKKQEEMEAELKNTEKFLSSLKNKLNNAEEYIKELDTQMGKLTDNIYSLEEKAEVKKVEIETTKAQLQRAEEEILKRYEDMKLRIQYMYENGNTEIFLLFASSGSVTEFLNKAEYINKITEYDRKMLDELRAAKDDVILIKETLEAELVELEDTLAEVSEELAAVEVLAAAKHKELNLYEDGIAETKDEIKALEEEIKAQEELVKELERIEEERKKQEALGNLKVTYDGGQLIWPLPGYSRISSKFGPRTHPVTGEKQSQHNGIDIPAPTGTKIQACYDGVVAWSGYHKTAGNWVGIDHGNGLYTIYMHMSKRLVSEGDKVKKGDIIGKVGSTGRSTGPHLHLGVRLNGKYYDPTTYVNPLITS